MRRVDDGKRSAEQYNTMAVDYAADNAESPYTAYYERPATISLLGDVTSRRVLEVGCGAGILSAWLVDHGARVTAFDVSDQMLALARIAVSDKARLLMADLAQPLFFAADHSFDLVVASLVLHYVEDWQHVFREFHRVLAPEGVVVFSTHHPTMDWEHNPDDYFATKQVTERWHKGSAEFDVTFWRRPLTAMTHAIASAGFVIEQLVEPSPVPELRDRDPGAYKHIATRPRFLFFRLRAEGSRSRSVR
jgi:ubiquinone/menaquinone biosynthesis C-methylase UbiE